MSAKLKDYLGDSVYADFDGWFIILTTENGRPDDPSNQIAIEPQVLDKLIRYAHRVNPSFELPELRK